MKWDLLNKLGFSKRHVATILYVLAVGLNKKLGLGLEAEDIMYLTFGVVSYVIGDTAGKFAGLDMSKLAMAFLKRIMGATAVEAAEKAVTDAADKPSA